MSADSFHHLVEKSLKNFEYNGLYGEVHNFNDFKLCVEWAKPETVVIEPEINDFFEPKMKYSQHLLSKISPRPYIEKICEIKIIKGSYHLLYRNDFEDDFIECCIFTKRQINEINDGRLDVNSIVRKNEPRGIDIERKKTIIQKLGPLMFPEKIHFWNDLHEKQDIDDL